jgi:diguanylate cyclase
VVEEAGCRLGQGSLFGWGVPPEHLEAQLRTLRTGYRPAPAQRPTPPPGAAARSQVIVLGPGKRQLRAILPTDPAFADDEAARSSDQHVGSVDSAREIGQG